MHSTSTDAAGNIYCALPNFTARTYLRVLVLDSSCVRKSLVQFPFATGALGAKHSHPHIVRASGDAIYVSSLGELKIASYAY